MAPVTQREIAMSLAKLLSVTAATGLLQGCTLAKAVVYNTADLDDYLIFANREVAAADEPAPLRALSRVPGFMARLEVPDERGDMRPLDRYLDDTRTAAFVVIRDDRIVYERYARGYGEHSLLNSFSIAKAVMATLVGIAVAEGHLDLEARVSAYRPDLANAPYGAVIVKDLLRMTSGMADAPSLLPGRAQYYYGDDLKDVIARAVADDRGRGAWRYSEADVQVLGFVLESATGKSLSAYLADKLWKPLGMESAALWALDREGGVEKAFCCISARARDFARFGRLYLDAGRWKGEQLVPASWAALAVLAGVRTPDGYLHRHLWWMPPGDEGDFYAYGHNGQYLYVNPSSRTVIVKFSETERQDPVPMFRAIAASLKPPHRAVELDALVAPRFAAR
jgi:CubicO group peptidase (beta-lactamase class C family)